MDHHKQVITGECQGKSVWHYDWITKNSDGQNIVT